MAAGISRKRDLRIYAMRAEFALKNAAGLRPAALRAAELLGRSRQLVFCVTNGRSGSATLAEYFRCLAAVDAEHEPEPKLSWLMRHVQGDPKFAEDFWLYRKLPAIAKLERPTYVETSNLFGKGFFEPLLATGIVPDLLMLRRGRRAVAGSLYRLGWVPGRTKYGRLFFLDPDDPVLCSLPDWRQLTDYQLCFWQTLEMEARQAAYADEVRRCGGRAITVELGAIAEAGYFEAVAGSLGIEVGDADRARVDQIRGRAFNEKGEDTVRTLDRTGLDEEESEVLGRVGRASGLQNV